MKVISIANQKGGVGKTTTAIEFGHTLAKEGKKVLLIDFDQQTNLTKYLNIKTKNTIFRVMTGDIDIKDALISTGNMHVIAGSEELSTADRRFIDANDIYLLSDICLLADKFLDLDYVIIDNSPARNILLTMSYIASDYVITPTECDEGSLDGIIAIEQDISKLRDGRHKISDAKMSLIILNKYEKTTMHNTALEVIQELSEKKILGAPPVVTIRKSIKTSESKTMKKPLGEYAKYNNTSMDYRKAVKVFLEKIKEDENE